MRITIAAGTAAITAALAVLQASPAPAASGAAFPAPAAASGAAFPAPAHAQGRHVGQGQHVGHGQERGRERGQEHGQDPGDGHSHGRESVRYVSVKGCPTKGGGQRPCGDWRLLMHSGEVRRLTDAQTVALDAKGKPAPDATAPIVVSGNGRKLAYFTRSGRLAVRTLGGGVEPLAGNALPRVAQYDVTLQLSDDGARLAAVIGGDRPAPTRIFDTATGARIGTVPAGETFLGFSGDGGEVLTRIDADEAVSDLAAYSDTGERLARVTPPQIVSANGPQALSGDGRTVAALVRAGRPRLVRYDLPTDQVVGRTRVTLPKGDLHMIDWTGPAEVTLHLLDYRDERPDRMTIVRIDIDTGKVTVRDRYTLLKDTFVFAACGG
ncbi:hypothetical protein [Nonomuraea lactucae]|uniref:hypothetical protein n=1 Tax=Nonomuraea lactucae TaxID=2249762 RepID=UPI0013B3F125|nr:hypothetical protein [Nonomuraea lactucae]